MIAVTRHAARDQEPTPAAPFHLWTSPDGTPWTEFHREGGGYRVRFPDLADFLISADAGTVAWYPAPDVAEATVEHLYLNQVLPLMLSKQGRLVFHGAAVEIGAGAVAFLAETGRGKSTLAASFALNGHRFLTDDGLLLGETAAGFDVQPSHPSIRLWEDSETALVGARGRKAPPVDYTPKARFLADAELRYCDRPRLLLRAYFLGEGEVDEPCIVPLEPAEAVMHWVRHSLLLDVEEQPRLASHFDRVTALANRPIHFRLDYPRRFEDLGRVRQAIVEHVREETEQP